MSWKPDRTGVAVLALLTAALTGAAGAALGGTTEHLYGAGAYLAIAGVAVFSPGALVVQVIAGQMLAGSVLVGPEGAGLLAVVPLVAGVVITAELLGVTARIIDTPERHPGEELRRVGVTALLGGGVFGVVAVLGRLPGPGGLLGAGLAGGALVLVAMLLAKRRPWRGG